MIRLSYQKHDIPRGYYRTNCCWLSGVLVRLSVWLFVCLAVYLSACLSVCLSACLSVPFRLILRHSSPRSQGLNAQHASFQQHLHDTRGYTELSLTAQYFIETKWRGFLPGGCWYVGMRERVEEAAQRRTASSTNTRANRFSSRCKSDAPQIPSNVCTKKRGCGSINEMVAGRLSSSRLVSSASSSTT